MRESPAGFRARTGREYRPAETAGAAPGARPLRDDEACPTLFRYPGPHALADALARGLPPLAPPGGDWIWLADDPLAAAPGPVRRFGALVILQPLRLAPLVVVVDRGGARSYVAPAQPVEDELVAWLPPSRAPDGGAAWDAVADARQARALLGPGADAERAAALDRLGAYIEELAALAAAGAPPPDRPWCDVDAVERARLLAERGVTGRFTPRFG